MKANEALQTRELLQQLARNFGLLQKEGTQCCGITVIQSHILYEVGKRPNLSQLEVSELLSIDTSTISRQVNALVKDGFLNRTPDPSDRRYVVLSLTQEGSQKNNEIAIQMVEYVHEIFSRIPPEKHEQVFESMSYLAAAMKENTSSCSAPPCN